MRVAVAGIVLAGGQSSRMGAPKAWLEVDGETLLARTARVLGEVCARVVVVAAAEQPLPALPASARVVRDGTPGRGPLEGLAAGLDAIGDDDVYACAFVCATDAPFLHAAFVRRMIALLGDEDRALVPEVGGRLHPLAAVYRPSARAAITEGLAAGDLRLTSLARRLGVRTVDAATLLAGSELAVADSALRSLINVNTRADYEAALATFAERERERGSGRQHAERSSHDAVAALGAEAPPGVARDHLTVEEGAVRADDAGDIVGILADELDAEAPHASRAERVEEARRALRRRVEDGVPAAHVGLDGVVHARAITERNLVPIARTTARAVVLAFGDQRRDHAVLHVKERHRVVDHDLGERADGPVEEGEELARVEVERRGERDRAGVEDERGREPVGHVEREVADAWDGRGLPKSAEAANEERVGRERLEVAIDLRLAGLADARGRERDVDGAACAQRAEGDPGPRELEEVERDAIGARVERGDGLRQRAAEDEEAPGRWRAIGRRDGP